MGRKRMIPDRASCYCLWDTYAVPEKKRIHLELVARVAEFFAMKLKSIYPTINTSLLVAAALLHDIDKSVEKLPDENHPDAAVRILKKEGMEEVAVLVKTHPLHAILDENISPKTIEEKLLFLADNAMRDFYRELNFRTLARFRTLHEGLLAFVAGKVIYALAIVVLGAVILLGGAALIFQFQWQHPGALGVLVLVYALFGAGLMGFIAALAGHERHADRMNNLMVMILALAGGCMFPPEQLPGFVRDHVMPLMPTAWGS